MLLQEAAKTELNILRCGYLLFLFLLFLEKQLSEVVSPVESVMRKSTVRIGTTGDHLV